MSQIVLIVLFSLFDGFALAAGTQFLASKKVAHRYPVGPLLGGIYTGLVVWSGWMPIFVGAISGLAGWVIYRKVFPLGKKPVATTYRILN